MTDKWTPREERSRDKWRKRGRLAQIQIEEGLSRQELADKFAEEAAVKTEEISPITGGIVYQSDETPPITNHFFQVAKQFVPTKKKK